MTWLLAIAVPWIAMSTWLVHTLIANRRLRQQIAERLAEDAERAARALGSMVVVDGVELPKPEDERWKHSEDTLAQSKKPISVLVLGVVSVGGEEVFGYNEVWIAREPLNPGAISAANKKYAAEVWRCYRTRLVRKSIDGE